MCGICGIVDFDRPVVSATIQAMTDSIRHRGPDDQGVALLGSAALGHRRLSIIDLSATGHQPMQSSDGRYWISYNGEVYNFPEVRQRLLIEGCSFRGTSDTEVVLEAFASWSTRVFGLLNGMFAIAIWDTALQQLHLARDRFGIKPLYYHHLPRSIVFGSEIKSILASGRVNRDLSWPALHEYLYYGNALGSRTLFDGVQKLLPAHHAVLNRNGLQIEPFWQLEELKPIRAGAADAIDQVRQRLDCAVRDHLISDVPVGVFLSGGIDSSAITALATRHYKGRLSTYSVAFDFDEEKSELPQAQRVAEHFKTDHHPLRYAPWNIPEIIERLVRSHDEPFADPANIPLFLLCEQLGGQPKVILQGDGGDEIFAGYRRYNVLAHERFWQTVSRAAVSARFALPRGPRMQRALRFFDVMSQTDPNLRTALFMTTEVRQPPPTRVFSRDALAHLSRSDPFSRYLEMYRRFEHLDAVQRMLYIDSQILLPDTFLEKVDKSTMAHGIEIRVPFLDANLTSYVMALPSRLKVRGTQKKWILRKALRGTVPDWVLDAPKAGFSVPVANWLRGPLVDYMKSLLLDESTLNWGVFDRGALESCINDHVSRSRNNGLLLYKLIQLVIWRNLYLS